MRQIRLPPYFVLLHCQLKMTRYSEPTMEGMVVGVAQVQVSGQRTTLPCGG